MGPDIIVLLLFCFPEKCDNSKHTNIFFSTVKGKWLVCQKQPFSLFLCYFWHMEGQARPSSLLPNNKSEGWMFTTTPFKGGKRDVRGFVFVCSQCSTWRAVRRAEGAAWEVRGHSDRQRRIPRHSGTNNIHESQTTCFLPPITILLSQVAF